MQDSQTVKLKFPIQVAGSTVSELKINRIKTGTLRKADKIGGSELDRTLGLIRLIAEPAMSPDEIDQIDQVDLEAISVAIGNFSKASG